MNWLLLFCKRLTCSHIEGHFFRNIYGDEINYANARSVYQCNACGKYIYKQDMNRSEEAGAIDFVHATMNIPEDTRSMLIEESSRTKKQLVDLYKSNQEKVYVLSELT